MVVPGRAFKMHVYIVHHHHRNLFKLGSYSAGILFNRGHGIPVDYTMVTQWLLKADKQEYAEVQCGIGLLYHLGDGVPQDHAQAMEWLLKAAHQEQVAAQYLVETFHESGQHVLMRYKTTVEWYGKPGGNWHQQTQARLEALKSKMAEEERVGGKDHKCQ